MQQQLQPLPPIKTESDAAPSAFVNLQPSTSVELQSDQRTPLTMKQYMCQPHPTHAQFGQPLYDLLNASAQPPSMMSNTPPVGTSIGKSYQNEILAHTQTRAVLQEEHRLRLSAEDALWKCKKQAEYADHYRQLLENRIEQDPVFVNTRASLQQERLASQQLRNHVQHLEQTVTALQRNVENARTRRVRIVLPGPGVTKQVANSLPLKGGLC